MSRAFLSILALISLALMIGCAHHRDVRPGADGIHRVVTRGPEKEDVERDAISQANHYCGQFEKSAAFVKEETKYTGSMDEDTHNTLRTASKAAAAVGGSMQVFGGGNERNAGQVATGGGMAGGIMTGGDAYTSDMRFKCQ
jgi:hypothetical protein